MKRPINKFKPVVISLLSLIAGNTFAVGGGVNFDVHEGTVPAFMHNLTADSMDLTYHACTMFTQSGGGTQLHEAGYFWVSSYQNINSVVDSQINHAANNGYHVYGIYNFSGPMLADYNTELGHRRDFQIQSGEITLYLDPDQNTNLILQGCSVAINGNGDDTRIGFSMNVLEGEKSEKEDIANGDFEIRYTNWTWDMPAPIDSNFLQNRFIFTGNITELGGMINQDHYPEGSGNIFWDYVTTVP